MAEITTVVVRHFTPELERAMRCAFEELVGSALPPRSILELDASAPPRSGNPSIKHSPGITGLASPALGLQSTTITEYGGFAGR